ncbi:MAG TPA: hypothetical protein VJ728_07955 [Candidatus Binataceae bacterium]|nr:hypothetical protein [Candidatus Binataceae bacterium]
MVDTFVSSVVGNSSPETRAEAFTCDKKSLSGLVLAIARPSMLSYHHKDITSGKATINSTPSAG